MTVQAGRLPEHARRAPGHLHYSFKYSGKCQGVSACTFVDERDLFWHSLVFSAAERESAYVIGGIMRNAVVKSDIHSTGTHGFSEAIFIVTHPVGNQLRSPHQESEKAEPPYVPVTPGRRPCQPDDKTRAICGSKFNRHRLGRRSTSCRHHYTNMFTHQPVIQTTLGAMKNDRAVAAPFRWRRVAHRRCHAVFHPSATVFWPHGCASCGSTWPRQD